MNILLTGGTGYIGSHIAVFLQQSGVNVILFDNLSNSQKIVLDKIKQLTNKTPIFVQGNLLDTDLLIKTLKKFNIDTVIHLAASKSILESSKNPIDYYENNIAGSLHLFKAMQKTHVRSLIFASSSAVYGEAQSLPIGEDHPKNPVNPYGRSKLYIEEILSDIVTTHQDWRVVLLRYFNVAGAHDSGLITECPPHPASNIFSVLRENVLGNQTIFPIYGNHYPTKDGTTVRDYVHVMDVAKAHLQILQWMSTHQKKPLEAFNLGSGQGYSIIEIIKLYEQCTGQKIKYDILPARPGDVAVSQADITKIKKYINWSPEQSLDDMCNSFMSVGYT